MNHEIVAHRPNLEGTARGSEQPQATGRARVRTVAIGATFTADLLREPLQFWLDQLEVDADIVLAPYAQLLQELLNPQSTFSKNAGDGFNIMLIRPEDWIRDRQQHSVEENVLHIRRTAQEFVAALRVMRSRTSAMALIVLCAPSSGVSQSYLGTLTEVESDLRLHLSKQQGVHCWTHRELMQLYNVPEHEDPAADRIGHIPYTSHYFTALATLLARRVVALVKPPYKVIAIDCDNTLWRGVCGEDGVHGVEITPAHLQLQRLLVQQYEAGVLLCLCTKNNPADVDAVFDARPEMVLRREHLVSSRINWEAKSANLQALANELELGLDSFMLIDDSAMECAEVRNRCPSVLTLQFPQTPDAVAHFLDHVWAFDRVGATAEAKQRTLQYRQNRARNQALQESADLHQFLAALELKIEIAPLRAEHLARAAELTLRTNQFNFTTVRRTAAEIEAALKSGELEGRVVHVRDRFGDYGLVGLILFRCTQGGLDVDTFLLSCRVLGRGVEQHIVNELGRIARAQGGLQLTVRYRATPRSAPARTFIEQSFGQFRSPPDGDEAVFHVPVAYAERLGAEQASQSAAIEELAPQPSAAAIKRHVAPIWHEIAFGLTRVEDIVQEIRRSAPQAERATETEYCAPGNSTERALADIWAQVLRLPRVGVLDDFFDLGGDSLMAVQVVSRIASQLDLDLTLHEFFEHATIEAVAKRLGAAATSGGIIPRAARQEWQSLSSAQQRLWFIDRLEGGSTAYHIPLALRLQGELNEGALRSALDALLWRHEALRTRFAAIDGRPVQQIDPAAPFVLGKVDLREEPSGEARWRQLAQQELATPFDLGTGPLIRGKLVQLAEREHILLITMHHIACDGWSIGVLIREIGVLYESLRNGRADPLPPLRVQYGDYAEWQSGWLESMGVQEQLRYWLDNLRGAPELLSLPLDRPRPMVQSYRGSSVPVAIDPKLAKSLNAFARRHQVTLAMVLFTAWSVLLARLSGQTDLVLGMPVANRRRTELEELIGFFVNSLAIRVQLGDEPTVADLLHHARQVMLAAYSHQDVPFERVVEALQPVRSLSHAAIFQVMFVLQNAPREPMELAGLSLVEEEIPLSTAQFDLSLSLQERAGTIAGALTYATDLFDEATVRRWVEYFKRLLGGMVDEPQQRITELPLLPAQEREQVVESFNSTCTLYPHDRSVAALFEQQTVRAPEAPACVDALERWSYADLNGRANRLARYLAGRGVEAGECIAVLLSRSAQLLAAQLAILKLGAIYVPMASDLPNERRQFLLRDCGARTLLAESDEHKQAGVDWIDLTRERAAIDAQSSANLERSIDAGAPACVMYTSGSTGVPKGVVVPHRGIVRLVVNNAFLRVEATDAIAHHSSPIFDASTLEVWGALLNGAKVVVVPQRVALEAHRFGELLVKEGVTILYMSVGLFNQYAAIVANAFPGLQYLMVGGDSLDPVAIRRVLRGSRPQRLLNVYGPTECTCVATSYEIEAVADGASSIPIGRPISNTRAYILNSRLEPVPIGVSGEIYLGGDGVACGYLNRPDLTAERFIRSPFDAASTRLYKTGDLGRWRADGTIEFLGRNDHQVKIRGFRVELGEIEAQLARHPDVADVTVLVRPDPPGEKRLVAYLVSSGAELGGEQLRSFLKDSLPEYMVPSAFVFLERLPLTPTGKVDRGALPVPDLTAYGTRRYEAPRGEAERSLAQLWQSLLRLERVGRDDNFFELGGHSLLAMQMTARLQLSAAAEVPVRLVFEHPVLKDLGRCLGELQRAHLADRIEDGGRELEQLLERIAAMPEDEARAILGGLDQE